MPTVNVVPSLTMQLHPKSITIQNTGFHKDTDHRVSKITHTHTHAQTHTQAHARTHTHTHTHTHAHTHSHTHTHTHTRTPPSLLALMKISPFPPISLNDGLDNTDRYYGHQDASGWSTRPTCVNRSYNGAGGGISRFSSKVVSADTVL